MANVRFLLTPQSSDSDTPTHLKPGPHEIPLARIQQRKGTPTHKFFANHVLNIPEPIKHMGLLEPLVLDHLLAGGHRLAALQLLTIQDPESRRNEFDARRDLEGEDVIADENEDEDDEDEPKKSGGWQQLRGYVECE